ncbi:hypothetical protein ACQ4M3_13250 [Leptolyngbya sp. AN03gr2]|uniref:hypothetical protein n=1 Tax=unclassified Leptolyngbya TaxID=2650499 RepID=UPI003D31321C
MSIRILLAWDNAGDAYLAVGTKQVGFYYDDELEDSDAISYLELISRALTEAGKQPELFTADLGNVLSILANLHEEDEKPSLQLPMITSEERSQITGEQSALAFILNHREDWLSQHLQPYIIGSKASSLDNNATH